MLVKKNNQLVPLCRLTRGHERPVMVGPPYHTAQFLRSLACLMFKIFFRSSEFHERRRDWERVLNRRQARKRRELQVTQSHAFRFSVVSPRLSQVNKWDAWTSLVPQANCSVIERQPVLRRSLSRPIVKSAMAPGRQCRGAVRGQLAPRSPNNVASGVTASLSTQSVSQIISLKAIQTSSSDHLVSLSRDVLASRT